MAKITYIDGTIETIDPITWDFLKGINDRYYEIIDEIFIRIVTPDCFSGELSYNNFNIATIPYPYEQERENIIIIEMNLEEFNTL